MTCSAESFSPTSKRAVAAAARSAVVSVLARIAYRRRVYRTSRMLSALDDTILCDIGLDRDQIVGAARHAATAAVHRLQR